MFFELPLVDFHIELHSFTVKNQRKTNCNLICLLLQYTTKEDLLPHLLECDIIMYDITGSPDQVDEATWAVSGKFMLKML